jgi:hypothetical protein
VKRNLLIPDSPIACTRWSTRRVETPPIQASWITATSYGGPRIAVHAMPIQAGQLYDVQALPWLPSIRSMSAAKSLYRSPKLWVAKRSAAVASPLSLFLV